MIEVALMLVMVVMVDKEKEKEEIVLESTEDQGTAG